jgi:hypothetical protein
MWPSSGDEKCRQNFGWKSRKEEDSDELSSKLKYNIKINLSEIGLEGVAPCW